MFTSKINKEAVEERKKNLPWIEKYRPTNLDEVIAHDEKIKILKELILNNQLPHLLFYGAAGSGKTSLILALARQMYGDNYKHNILELNASDERGIDTIRTKIPIFAKTKSNHKTMQMRLVILDEFDNMTTDAQSALRRIMEKYMKNCRFCLICNKVNKVIDGIKSRCIPMRFGVLDRQSVRTKIEQIIKIEKIKITSDAVDVILDIQSDFRQVLNTLQCLKSITFDDQEIDKEMVVQYLGLPDSTQIDEIVTALETLPFKEVYAKMQLLFQQNLIDLPHLIQKLTQYVIEAPASKLTPAQRRDLLNGMAEAEYRMIVGSDTEIQLAALVGEWLATIPR
jgi:replication factor C subunit 3/5